MMKLNIDYPSQEEELKIMKRMTDLNFNNRVKAILSKRDITSIKNSINNITLSESVEKYIVQIVFASRNSSSIGLDDVKNYTSFGASPRASINLSLAGKANAFMNNRDYVTPDDIKEVANDVLNHRIILNFEAEVDGVTSSEIIRQILEKVEVNS